MKCALGEFPRTLSKPLGLQVCCLGDCSPLSTVCVRVEHSEEPGWLLQQLGPFQVIRVYLADQSSGIFLKAFLVTGKPHSGQGSGALESTPVSTNCLSSEGFYLFVPEAQWVLAGLSVQ